MYKIKNKIKLITGLILIVFITLFLHSEVELFHHHSEICESIDFCLLVNTTTTNNLSFKNIIKEQNSVNYIPSILLTELANSEQDFVSSFYQTKYQFKLSFIKKFISNLSLII